ARVEAAESLAWRSEQSVRGELGVVRQQALQNAQALPALARQREQLSAVVRASDLQYQAGRRSLLQLIDQRDRGFNADQREVEAAWRLRQAWLRMAVLTGSLAPALGVAEMPRDRVEVDPMRPPEQGLAPP
ncbi:MAG: hypothetical protein IIZ92_25115, partial [Aquincola sp.]|nr:hypothetical protein [Aquincola sp.]